MATEDPRDAAIRLLARREHSRRELQRKLGERGFDRAAVAATLDDLEGERLLSDARYAECFVRSRAERGYGPVRIRAELRERGVAGDVIERQLAGSDADWYAIAARVRQRRFGGVSPREPKARAKQMRFLQYRGFDGDQIRAAMRGDVSEND